MSNEKKQTLEQLRAADAWTRSREACASHDKGEGYSNLAKGLPALIMNSGLMQVMAFLHEKGDKQTQRHCQVLNTHLRMWLHSRFKEVDNESFEAFMQSLFKAKPDTYQRLTAEAYAWLRWVRQMSAAATVKDVPCR